ncbi:MAG: hypothetical protein OEY07_20400 [Gammaproteobacteria bacterium]|nr:hypothetical protein [Gammaproteobacteria bacterium]
MPDIHHVLSSSADYKQAFEAGLTQILQHKTAGTFILACANLFQHPELLQQNQSFLGKVYEHIETHYRACLRDNQQPGDAPDDIAVMYKLIEIGLDNLAAVEYQKSTDGNADYLLNYNQLRSFRPARMSKSDNIQLAVPFNENGFHFDKPFLKKEIFAEGEMEGNRLSLLYNKFPFIHYHALLVADKAAHLPQYLTRPYLEYITRLQIRTQQQCPEFVVTYNSLGAGASVNHLHFHTWLETLPLPIFSPHFKHNGGNRAYPAACQVLHNADEAWQAIEVLHNNNTPYNLIFKDKKIYCLPRKNPAEEITGFDLGMFGWSQLAGLINVESRELLTAITADKIKTALKAVSLFE